MEVKIFTKSIRVKNGFFPSNISVTDSGLEGEINLWLASNPDIKVQHITQSQSGGSWLPSSIVISVWYTK